MLTSNNDLILICCPASKFHVNIYGCNKPELFFRSVLTTSIKLELRTRYINPLVKHRNSIH